MRKSRRPFVANHSDRELATDLLAGLLMEASRQPALAKRRNGELTARVYATMAATTVATFIALASVYQAFFTHPLFA